MCVCAHVSIPCVSAVYIMPEEVGHIFCAHDYALHLNGNYCMSMFLTSPASFPGQYGLGPRENINNQQ